MAQTVRWNVPLASLLLLAASLAGAAEPLPLLESVGAVRALRPEEAARHYPVKLRGTVTFYSALDGHAFLQDASGGIFFRPGGLAQPGRLEFTPGERVEILGVTVRGSFSPSVAGGPPAPGWAAAPVQATRLGYGELPAAPLVSMDQLQSGEFHDQFVKVRATIREVDLHSYRGGQRLGVVLSTARGAEGAKVKAYVSDPAAAPTGWENVVAEVRGVVAGGGDEKARLRDVRLLVPSPAEVTPDRALLARAFAQEPRAIGELFRYEPPEARGASQYLRVRDLVTLARPGEGFYLGAGESGLWVQTPQLTALTPGDEVEAIGLPARDDRRAVLQDAIFRVTGRRTLPPARLASSAEAAGEKYVSARIAVQGELLDKLQQPGFRRLFLEDAGRTFQARIAETGGAAGYGWKTGSRLRLTGICEPAATTAPGAPPAAFTLLVATEADVAVIRQPPWLTLERLRGLVLALASAIALCALWVALLRRQVAHQTRVIAAQTAQKALTEERHRIARELHDTLEQQLAGVHLHLDAVHDWLPEAPGRVRSALRTARAMLEHSRSEARQSVFELRSPALEELGLAGALRHSAAQFAGPGAPRIEVTLRGAERRLPRLVEFHLLRIVQEAITNAWKHAGASAIAVAFEFDPQTVRVTVRDDGRGFDPAARPADGRMHFGLLGMRERVAKIQGRIEVQSAPGAGTVIAIDMPAAAGTEAFPASPS